MLTKQNSQRGFSLVELSIVLVVIGLIVSSVLVGQTLVRSAELRSTTSQYQGFNAAIAAFKTKYNSLPGDAKGFTKFGFGADAANGDGDGDGILTDGTFSTYSSSDVRDTHGNELVFFWNHLGSSGSSLLPGSFLGTATGPDTTDFKEFVPPAKSGGYWGVYSASNVNYFILGATGGGTRGKYVTENILSPNDAMSIDEKIDDGKPNRGVIKARGASGSDPDNLPTFSSTSSNTVCTIGSSATDSGALYNSSSEQTNCTLKFKMSF